MPTISGGGAFNGGTITGTGGGGDGQLVVQKQAGQLTDSFVIEDENGIFWFQVGLGQFNIGGNGEILVDGNTHKVGFYDHAATVQQTGVAVTIAAVHAALVNLGLITA